jgi:TPR repeat protein
MEINPKGPFDDDLKLDLGVHRAVGLDEMSVAGRHDLVVGEMLAARHSALVCAWGAAGVALASLGLGWVAFGTNIFDARDVLTLRRIVGYLAALSVGLAGRSLNQYRKWRLLRARPDSDVSPIPDVAGKSSVERKVTKVAAAVAIAVVALFGLEEAYFYFAVLQPGFTRMITVAEGGDAAMQTEVGMIYQKGGIPRRFSRSSWHIVGITADPSKAAFWYQRAAEQNYSEAEWLLAFLIANGQGIQRDDAQVVKWVQRSAEHGNPMGQWILGKMYESGYNGVPRDRLKAVQWYRRAAAQGQADAIKRLRTVDSR